MTWYTQLDDQFVRHWNDWYKAASASMHAAQARHLAHALLRFLSSLEGRWLIQETVKRVAARKVRLPYLCRFQDEVQAARSSLHTFIVHPGLSPDAASEFLANMQEYMALCR